MASEVETVALRTGVNLAYSDNGDRSHPVLLLLPGPTDSWLSYQPVLQQMSSSSLRAIAVSQRGHGDSDKPATGYRIHDFSEDVVALLDALDVDRAVLAGHSGSCLVARRVAIDAPDRVAGLVLEASPTSLHGNMTLMTFVDSVISTLEDPIDSAFARSFVADTSSPNLAPELLDQLVDEIVKVPARVWREMFTELLEYDDTAQLADISAPALLIWGSSDGLVDRGMQEQLRHPAHRSHRVRRSRAHTAMGRSPSLRSRRGRLRRASVLSDILSS